VMKEMNISTLLRNRLLSNNSEEHISLANVAGSVCMGCYLSSMTSFISG
jgi:hypothetical protein